MGLPLFASAALGVSCVVAEAGNQPLPGMIGVAEVIRNRMERHYQSDGTLPGTIFKPWQFSCYGDKNDWRPRIFKLEWDEPQVQAAWQAWMTVHTDDGSGVRSDVVKGAVLYHTIKAPVRKDGKPVPWPPSWATAPGVVEVARIGDHVFYDDRGRE